MDKGIALNLTATFRGTRAALRILRDQENARQPSHALGPGAEPKDTEGIRAKLKRLVKRRLLTETEPGLFALATLPAPADQAVTSNSNQD